MLNPLNYRTNLKRHGPAAKIRAARRVSAIPCGGTQLFLPIRHAVAFHLRSASIA